MNINNNSEISIDEEEEELKQQMLQKQKEYADYKHHKNEETLKNLELQRERNMHAAETARLQMIQIQQQPIIIDLEEKCIKAEQRGIAAVHVAKKMTEKNEDLARRIDTLERIIRGDTDLLLQLPKEQLLDLKDKLIYTLAMLATEKDSRKENPF